MDDEGLLEVARVIRPYLPELVERKDAGRLDRRIAELLAAASRGENVTAALRSLLDSDEATSAFVGEVLCDAPYYRPPYLQPHYSGTRGITPLSAYLPPVKADKYVCPHGDYVWYRLAAEVPVSPCRTHGPGLVPT